MTKKEKEKVKAFFNKHKKGFVVGSVGFVSFVGGTAAIIKSWRDSSRIKATLESAIAQSYEENKEITRFAYSEDDNHLIYKSTVKVFTECIGD